MEKLICLLFVGIIGTAAWADEGPQLPWADKCARIVSYRGTPKLYNGFSQYNWIGPVWADIEVLMAELLGKPKVQISFEYVNYRSGDEITSNASYAPGCNDFPEDDDELKSLNEKSRAGTLIASDFKGPRWLHLIQPIDRDEVNCLALSKINGKLGGCGDLWQDGVTSDEVVCFNKKTYLKCHVACIQKIYSRDLKATPGFCPEGQE